MFFNFLAAFALFVDNDEPIHEDKTFGISILYLVANVPLSFLGWYRPAYNGWSKVSKDKNHKSLSQQSVSLNVS